MTGDLNVPEDEERDWRIYLAYTAGRKTQLMISKEFGIGQQRVSSIIANVRAKIPVSTVDEMREQSVQLYQEMIRRALDIVDLTPAPVFVGKDGSIAYDEGGSVVRDYSGRLNAMQVAAKMDEQLRKLYGLDAATKVEQSGAVRFEIVGVDPEDLS